MWRVLSKFHYSGVIMRVMASQITGVSIVCSTVGSNLVPRKHHFSPSLSYVRGIHRSPVNSPHKRPVSRKMFPFDDVIINVSSDGSTHMLPTHKVIAWPTDITDPHQQEKYWLSIIFSRLILWMISNSFRWPDFLTIKLTIIFVFDAMKDLEYFSGNRYKRFYVLLDYLWTYIFCIIYNYGTNIHTVEQLTYRALAKRVML